VNHPNDPARTFGSLTEVLDFAIRREIEAAEGYGRMARRSRHPEVKALLLDLQREEQGHEKLLRDLAEGRLAAWTGRQVADLKISDYTVDEPVGEESSLQDLLLFAAKKEAVAVALYTVLGQRAEDPDHRRLFEFLVQEERSHKLRLEQEYESHILEEN
jgi:rubrerythrin